MNQLLSAYIEDLQDRNMEAIVTLLNDSTAIVNHNVGNYTLEYIDTSEDVLKRQHIPFCDIKMMFALVGLHSALNSK